VAVVAVPLLLLVTVLVGWQLHRDLADAREAALRTAKATAGRIAEQHDSSVALLKQMAARPSIRDFNGTCDPLFALVDLFPQWFDLRLYDRAGRLVCSAGPPDVLRHQLSAVTQAVTGSDGSPHGTLVLLQEVDFSPREALLPNSVITILDRDGKVLARSAGTGTIVGRYAGNAELARIAMGEHEGSAAAVGLDGVSRQYGFTQIAPLGWTVYAGVPTANILRPVWQAYIAGTAGVALIVLLIRFLAVWLARRIERPVSALVTAAETAARTGYGRADTEGGPSEIVRLSAAFNEMLERRSAAENRTRESERNLKALSESLLNAHEQERLRIAREIHDDLGQALTALKMDIIGLIEKTKPSPEIRPMVDRILRTVDATVTAVQRISSELRPGVLDDLGLYAAIEAEALLFEERTGIECELSLPDDAPDIDKSSGVAIYRIVQEALTNVARHSNAGRVEIRIRQRTNIMFLEIRDDGRGITPAELANASSLGLAGIRERADMIGATALIEGVPGRGTIVSIRIPLGVRTGSEA
jgi:signal transduction histidine kinase